MELFIARVIVNAFDPIGVLLPAFVAFIFLRKHQYGWVLTALVVGIWKAVGAAALLPMSNPALMGLFGAIGGAFWFWLAKGFGALKDRMRASTAKG